MTSPHALPDVAASAAREPRSLSASEALCPAWRGLANPSGAEHEEWLLTNGRGAFASQTVPGIPTRRYHGLLVAPLPGTARRHVFVSRFEESIHRADEVFALSAARYPGGVLAPEGHRALVAFTRSPWPTAEYEVAGGVRVRREVMMVRGRDVTLCRWSVPDEARARDLELELRPLFACREADALTVRNDALRRDADVGRVGFRFRPYDALPEVHVTLGSRAHRYTADPVWYENLHYARDAARGYDAEEDQFSPGTLRLSFARSNEVVVAIGLEPLSEEPALLWRRESGVRAFEAERLSDDVRGAAELAADDFLYRSPKPGGGTRLGVMAGWPWFLEWGRDTFLALPGLTLARGQADDCAAALLDVLDYLSDGLIPNIFARTLEESHYGSADAALWYARCVRLFEVGGGSRRFVVESFRGALTEIADAYFRGSGLGMEVDARSGLLRAGSTELNATWMDARTEDGPVTPRAGYAVELNALWYFLLAYLEELYRDSAIKGEHQRFAAARRKAQASFLARFWLRDEERLADCWTEEHGPDLKVRPNMVLAAALEFSPLTKRRRAQVVACARRELLTPRGLRTLSPLDEDYRGTYAGGPRERDEAYHQGTVWPWLLGFHVEASLRAGATRPRDRAELRALWDGFEPELSSRGLGHLSEVFSGDEPHAAGGSIAQAWNTAECLRSYALLETFPS